MMRDGHKHKTSIGNDIEAKRSKAKASFDNGVFFDNEAKRTLSIVKKLFSKPTPENESVR